MTEAAALRRAQLLHKQSAAEEAESETRAELQVQVESLRAQLHASANERTDLQTRLAGT